MGSIRQALVAIASSFGTPYKKARSHDGAQGSTRLMISEIVTPVLPEWNDSLSTEEVTLYFSRFLS